MADESEMKYFRHRNSYPASTDVQILALHPKPWPNIKTFGRSEDSSKGQ